MNEDIEREAGSIVATRCVRVERAQPEAMTSERHLGKDLEISPPPSLADRRSQSPVEASVQNPRRRKGNQESDAYHEEIEIKPSRNLYEELIASPCARRSPSPRRRKENQDSDAYHKQTETTHGGTPYEDFVALRRSPSPRRRKENQDSDAYHKQTETTHGGTPYEDFVALRRSPSPRRRKENQDSDAYHKQTETTHGGTPYEDFVALRRSPSPRATPRDKRRRSRSLSGPTNAERKALAAKLQAHEHTKEDSVPGVLLVSPVKSSSTSSYNTLWPPRKVTRQNVKVKDVGGRAPSPSRTQFDLIPWRDSPASPPRDRPASKLQVCLDRQQARWEWEAMSCASTKASTSSLLDLGLKASDADSCFGGDDQSIQKEVHTHNHVYPVDSPPKTRQAREAEQGKYGPPMASISGTPKKNSSQKIASVKTKFMHSAVDAASPSSSSKMASPKAALDRIQHDLLTQRTPRDFKIRSPFTQSLTTTTVESSDSIPVERLATLRQNVLNSEVKDSVHKLLFDATDQTSSSNTRARGQALKSASARAKSRHVGSKYGIRQALERKRASNDNSPKFFRSPPCLSKRRSWNGVDVFSPRYYLNKPTLHRLAGRLTIAQGKLQPFLDKGSNASIRGRRSHSFADHGSLSTDMHHSPVLRKSYKSVNSTEFDSNEGEFPINTKMQETKGTIETLGGFLNKRRSFSFGSFSDTQEGILEVEQPSLEDIDSDREGKCSLFENIQGGNNDAGRLHSEQMMFRDGHNTSEQCVKTIQEPFFSPNPQDRSKSEMNEKKNVYQQMEGTCSEKLVDPYFAENTGTTTTDENENRRLNDLHRVKRSASQLDHSDPRVNSSDCDVSKEVFPCPKPHDTPAEYSQQYVQCKSAGNRMSSKVANVSSSMTDILIKSGGVENAMKRKESRKSSCLSNGTIAHNKDATHEETVKVETKTSAKTIPRRATQPYLTKRHIPVSALITDISDICHGQRKSASSPGIAEGLSPLKSQGSLVEKLSKTSVKRHHIHSVEPVGALDCADKSASKHPVQNVSHLRRVCNFYGKRQMRITRSVGLMQRKAQGAESNFTINEHMKKLEHCDLDRRKVAFPKRNTEHALTFQECKDSGKSSFDLHQGTIRSNLSIHKSFKKKNLLRRNASGFKVPTLAEDHKRGREKNLSPKSATNASLSQTAEIRLVNKAALSGSTNNSSNNVPHRRDMVSSGQKATATFHCSAQTGSQAPYKTPLRLKGPILVSHLKAGGHQVANLHPLSSRVTPVPHTLSPSQNTPGSEKATMNRSMKSKELIKGKNKKASQNVKNFEKNEMQNANFRRYAPENGHIPITRVANQFLCRQNVSSSLRKAHALAKRKGIDPTKKGTWSSPTAIPRGEITFQTNSLDCTPGVDRETILLERRSAIPRLAVEESYQEKERNRLGVGDARSEIQKASDTCSSLHAVLSNTGEPSTTMEAGHICSSVTHTESVKPKQKTSNPDSGYDETVSTSERTGDQTYSLTGKQRLTSPEVQTEDIGVRFTNQTTHLDESTHPIISNMHKEQVISCGVNTSENDKDEDIAVRSDVGCVEQDTSSINTEDAFFSRASSFFGESDSNDDGKLTLETSFNQYSALKPSPSKGLLPTPEKHQFENVDKGLVKTKCTLLVKLETGLAKEKESKSLKDINELKTAAYCDSKVQHRFQSSASCCSILTPTKFGLKAEVSRENIFRKTSSAEIFMHEDPRGPKFDQLKSFQNSPSCPPAATRDRIDINCSFKGDSPNLLVRCKLPCSDSIDGPNEIKNQSVAATARSVSDSPSPSLDCFCVWTSSPCQCNARKETAPKSSSPNKSAAEPVEETTPDDVSNQERIGNVGGYIEAGGECNPGCTAEFCRDVHHHTLTTADQTSHRRGSFHQNGSVESSVAKAALGRTSCELEILTEPESIAKLAVQVSLPPTSSDDDDQPDDENEKKISSKIFCSAAVNSLSPKGESDKTDLFHGKDCPSEERTIPLVDRLQNFTTVEETDTNTLVCPTKRDHVDFLNEDFHGQNANLAACLNSASEEESSNFCTKRLLKTGESVDLMTQPSHALSEKKSLPVTLSDSAGSSSKRTTDRKTDDNEQPLTFIERPTCYKRCYPLKSSIQCASEPIAAKVESLVTQASGESRSLPKRVKIEKRSLAFQDLLKRFWRKKKHLHSSWDTRYP